MRWLVAVLLVAGCTQPAAIDAPEPPWAALALPYGPDHDHTDPAHHRNGTTPNFLPLAHEPMESLHYGQTAGGYLCGDVQTTRDGQRIAAVESRSDVGFALVDVTDPAAPEWLGELAMENAYVYDLAVVPDGKHVVLVTSAAKGLPVPASLAAEHLPAPGGADIPSDASSAAAFQPASDAHLQRRAPGDAGGAPRLLWSTPCGASSASDPLPYEDLLLLVDIQDPSAPRVVEAVRMAGHGHSAFSVDMDGTLMVLAVTLGPDTVNSWAHLFRIEEAAGSSTLVPVAVYKGPVAQETLEQVWHDGWIAKHPGTGGWLLHLVGSHEYTILDLEEPGQPRPLATWSDDDPTAGAWTGNLHSVVPLTELWDGRHFTVIGPEWGAHPEDHPSGILRVLDTTDPTGPFEVGAWTLPVDVEWEDGATYQFSNHYYAIDGTTLFASMYHGGVWAVDLRPVGTADWVNLPSLGVWQPLAPDTDSAIHVRWAPTNQEVFAQGSQVITFDSNTGLHTAVFDPLVPVETPAPWPLAPLHTR